MLIIGTIAVFALTRTGTGSSSQTNTQVTATAISNTPTATLAIPTTTSGSTGGSTGSSGRSTGSPSGGAIITPSQAILEQYYADINARDFNDAYNIWGSAYHKSTSSYQFAKGFDYTRSVSIAINSEGVILLNDGTVKVPLTITSTNTSGSGIVTHIYQGYYIIGIENEVWHMLSANLH